MYDNEQKRSAVESLADSYDSYSDLNNLNNSFKNAGEGAKDTAKDTAKNAGKEAAKEAGKEAGKTAAEAGVASTGVGAIPVVAEKAITIGAKVADHAVTDLSGSKIKFRDIAIGVGIFFMLISFVFMGAVHGLVGASSEKYHEDQYGKKFTIFDFMRSFFFRFFDEEEPGEYLAYEPLLESLTKNCEIFDTAFEKAYELAKEEAELSIVLNEYDYELTMESFYGNEYPFNNVNYAELISIFTQKEDFNIENLTFKKFKSFFRNEENIKYLYKMKIEDDYKDVTFWVSPEGETIRLSDARSAPEGGSTYTETLKYGKVTLLRYDLKALYEMIELNANQVNTHWECNNIDMLDSQEEYIRYFGRDFDLGPKIRSVWDNGLERSETTASEEDYKLVKDILLDDDLTDLQKYLLECALSKLGTTYSQAYRNKNGYFDCSSFVSWVYRNAGINFGSYSPTAAEMCRYLDNQSVNIGSTSVSNMQVGDLIFYSSKENGRYKSITHVAFYAGNGMIIDASSSKGMVVYRKLWGRNQIVSVARPLAMN